MAPPLDAVGMFADAIGIWQQTRGGPVIVPGALTEQSEWTPKLSCVKGRRLKRRRKLVCRGAHSWLDCVAAEY